ncbi:MAG TPA: histidine phosphatase family protein [Gaiellaceae bacterium]|jgi:phosphohistidine phosphatase SixA|nr:histidine phosphatase family protein [Gaiellaceae bacterium]
MRLFLVRHAEAAPGEPDELRPLTPAGRAVARDLGERLAIEQLDAVVSSPLLRARETAEQIARAAGLTPEAHDRLAPGATAEDLRAAIADRGDTVVAVGHQPDCSAILLVLSGRELDFAPGAVHEVQL